jgi:hypothetical protein
MKIYLIDLNQDYINFVKFVYFRLFWPSLNLLSQVEFSLAKFELV